MYGCFQTIMSHFMHTLPSFHISRQILPLKTVRDRINSLVLTSSPCSMQIGDEQSGYLSIVSITQLTGAHTDLDVPRTTSTPTLEKRVAMMDMPVWSIVRAHNNTPRLDPSKDFYDRLLTSSKLQHFYPQCSYNCYILVSDMEWSMCFLQQKDLLSFVFEIQTLSFPYAGLQLMSVQMPCIRSWGWHPDNRRISNLSNIRYLRRTCTQS